MEDARFALDKMNSEFRRTGYLTNRALTGWGRNVIYHNRLALDYAAGVYTIRNNGVLVPGTVLTMGNGEVIGGFTNLAGLNSDTVMIRYQLESGAELADNQYSPCTNGFGLVVGEQDTDRHIIAMVFYMEFDAGVGSNVLYCRAFRENLDTADTELLTAVPLISNVEKLRVLYGQTNATAVAVASIPLTVPTTVYRTNAQVSASAVLPDPTWRDVRSARISLVLRSEGGNLSDAVPGDYSINGKYTDTPANAAEKRLYRVFSTTAAFRN